MAKNNEKTLSQEKKSLKGWRNACFVGEFVSAITPFVAIGIANYEKYFIDYDGTRMSISFFMAVGLMGFVIWSITKKKLENSLLTFLIGWVVVAFILTMLGEMITDLSTIMWFGAIGVGGSYGLMEIERTLQKKIDAINDAQETATKENRVEQAKQEMAQQKTIKVKVKK